MKRITTGPPLEFAARPQVDTSHGQRMRFGEYDPICRFASTPHVASLSVMGRTVRLETNSANLLEHMVKLFAPYSGSTAAQAEFLWRIVMQPDAGCRSPWPLRSTFSDEGIRFAQFGRTNFLAVDIGAREGIGFVSDGLFEDSHGFSSPFVDTLFYMSAAPLGLTPFASACVRLENRGLLVLGPPNQGKTTASYLATRDGLAIHADQSVFLELIDNKLRAWGDFVPLAFRPETLNFLPELRSQAIPFSYCDFTFHYLPKPQQGADVSRFVTPICCVVLERETSSLPCLEPLEGSELQRCLAGHLAFQDDGSFEERSRRIVGELAHLPVYRLSYGSDPADAASLFRQLLTGHASSARRNGAVMER